MTRGKADMWSWLSEVKMEKGDQCEDVEGKNITGLLNAFNFSAACRFTLRIALEAGVEVWHGMNTFPLSLHRTLLNA